MEGTDELLLYLARDTRDALSVLPGVRAAAAKDGALRGLLAQELMEYDGLSLRLGRLLAARGLAGAEKEGAVTRMWAYVGLALPNALPGGDGALAGLMARASAMGRAELGAHLRGPGVLDVGVLAPAGALLAMRREKEEQYRRRQ